MPTARQIISVNGLPPGRDYLVSRIGVSQDAGINWTKDEIWAGQGYDQPTLPAISVLDEPASDFLITMGSNNLPNMDQYFVSSGESFANLPGPFAVSSSGWATWSNNQPVDFTELVTPWF